MAILHGLESGKPMLFIDNLVVSARPVRAKTVGEPPNVELDLQFELNGYIQETM